MFATCERHPIHTKRRVVVDHHRRCIDAFCPTRGPGCPVTAYSSAKAAVRVFTEILITDLQTYLGAFGHTLITGSFGTGSITIKDNVVMRVEPS